jgi:hypothetical protein
MGSLLDWNIELLNWSKASNRTMALGMTACNRNEYQEFFWG